MRILWAGFLLGAFTLFGCLTDEAVDTPLSSKENSLQGQWRLALADVATEEFEFNYTFDRGGSFSNRVGGAFLKQIEQLNEIDGIDIDTGQLDAIDGGFLVLHGMWSADGDSLDIGLETLAIEVFGTVPVLGRITVPIHEEPLMGSNRIGYRCRVEGQRLILNGDSLTLGLGLQETTSGLNPLAVEVLQLTADFALEQLSTRDEDEFTLLKVEK